MKLGKAIYTKTSPKIKDGKFISETDEFEVRVMATTEGWAMVRRKGCMPFVAQITDLRQ